MACGIGSPLIWAEARSPMLGIRLNLGNRSWQAIRLEALNVTGRRHDLYMFEGAPEGGLEGYNQLLAQAQAAASQVTVWQAKLVAAVRALRAHPQHNPESGYLGWALGMTGSEAREVDELAERLDELPATTELLDGGERSLRSVLAIARRVTPALETKVIEATEACTGSQLERVLREYQRVARPSERTYSTDIEELTEVDPEASSASWGWLNGRFRLRANFDMSDGLAMAAWLEGERSRITKVPGEAGFVPGLDRNCAEALLAMAEAASSAKANDVGFLPESLTVNLLIHAHENDEGVQVDRAYIPGVGPVPQWKLPMLVERGPLVTTVMVKGEPIMASVPDRFANAQQRRALLARDGGCSYPGCANTRKLIAHHIHYFDRGGPIELRNLVLLCRRHHRIVHRHELTILPDPNAPPEQHRWQFLNRNGQLLVPQSPGPNDPRLLQTRRRKTGTGEKLTNYAFDVLLTSLAA